MPYNGSGTFTLAEAAFVPNTPISSSAVNSDLSDIATNGLTNAVTKDGQTVITGPFKGASGSVGLPMYSFSADTDCGMYRIGANNVGISVNATKILDIATTGLSVVGTVAPSTTVTNADGTVLLPSYTFASDLDSGVYRIGANNIGVAVNATKILDISTSGLNVIGTVSSNGTAFAPLPQGVGMVNGTIVESHGSSAATFAIKTLAGADPSASDIVYFVFRNTTPGTGNYTVIQVTAALSITITNGSTVGTTNSIPFKLWLVAFNDAGTVRLAFINNVSGTNIYPLGQFPVASSTAEGGSGGADSPQVFYTGTAVTSKAYTILGYAAYESGMATAGAWTASPTRIELFGDRVPLPGSRIQKQTSFSGTLSTNTVTATVPLDNTIPQSNEGDQFLTQAITPTSTTNVLQIESLAHVAFNGGTRYTSALYQDATANALAVTMTFGTNNSMFPLKLNWDMLAATTSSTTFKIRCGSQTAATVYTFNGEAAAQLYGGVLGSFLSVVEVMT